MKSINKLKYIYFRVVDKEKKEIGKKYEKVEVR